jgi:Fe-S-cluster containining protein
MTDSTIGMFTPAPTRKCGTCIACCVHLGIEALNKRPGTPCAHLTRASDARRCSIYASRPRACQTYKCGWIEGLLDERTGRPDRSGLLITGRESPELSPPYGITIQIIDQRRCGTMEEGKLKSVIHQLLELGLDDIRVFNPETRGVIHFYRGKVRVGHMLDQQDSVEDLDFFTFDPPVGEYKTEERTPQ